MKTDQRLMKRTIPTAAAQREAVTRWIARFLVRAGLFALADLRGLAADYMAAADEGSTFADWMVERSILPSSCIEYVESMFAASRFRCGNCGAQLLGSEASDGDRMVCTECAFTEFSISGTGHSGMFKVADASNTEARDASASSRRRAPVLGSSDDHALPAEAAEVPAAEPENQADVLDPFAGMDPDASATSMMPDADMWAAADSLDEVHLPVPSEGDGDDTSVTRVTANVVKQISELLRQIETGPSEVRWGVFSNGQCVGSIGVCGGAIVAVGRGTALDAPIEEPTDPDAIAAIQANGGTLASVVQAGPDSFDMPVQRIRDAIARSFGRTLRNMVAGTDTLELKETSPAADDPPADPQLRFTPLELMVAVTSSSVDFEEDLTSALYKQWVPEADAAILLVRPSRHTGGTPVPLGVHGMESLPVSDLAGLCQAALGTGWSPRLAEAGMTPRLIVRNVADGCTWAAACTQRQLLLLRLDTSDKYKRVGLARLLSEAIARLDRDATP